MKVIDLKSMNEITLDEKTGIALGNFDGIHLGHKSVFNLCTNFTKKNGLKSLVYTFANLQKSSTDSRHFYTTEEKILAIKNYGFDYVCLEDFYDVKELSGSVFVNNILIDKLNAEYACCGFNFHFGINATSDAVDLKRYMTLKGKKSEICDEYRVNNQTLSSTYLKHLIELGNVEDVLKYATPYSINAKVVHGNEIGRTIQFPTINQSIPNDKIIPKYGVYITKTIIDGKEYPSITNIGSRPTVNDDLSNIDIETHILGFSENVYGKQITVSFYKYLRDEHKFGSIEDLKSILEKDKISAMDFFADDN